VEKRKIVDSAAGWDDLHGEWLEMEHPTAWLKER
jgi:hypothetical protein